MRFRPPNLKAIGLKMKCAAQSSCAVIKTAARWIANGFHFRGHIWCLVGLLALLAVGACTSHVALNLRSPGLCLVSIGLALIVALLLAVNVAAHVFTLLASARNECIFIHFRLDKKHGKQINEHRQNISKLTIGEQENRLAELRPELETAFQNRQLLPKVLRCVIIRSALNYIFTIICFAIVSLNIITLEEQLSTKPFAPYGHYCSFEGDPSAQQLRSPQALAVHLTYYHTVIFQSLGDGVHGPKTRSAEAIAIAESFIAQFYLIFMFGSVISAALFVHAEVTPKRLLDETMAWLDDAKSSSAGDSS